MVPKDDFSNIGDLLPELESEELVTRTFRRLDPERQQAVLTALFDEAAEKGPARLNIKQVAERSGASIGSLYQYFGSRENLLQLAVKIVILSMTESFKLWRPSLRKIKLRDALRTYLVEGMRYCQSSQSITKFLALAAYQGDEDLGNRIVRPMAEAICETVREILLSAQERGEIREDVDLEAAARVVNATLIVLGDSQLIPHLNQYFQVSDKTTPFERTLEAALDMIEHGLAPGGS